ncbi:MAG: hypothetical protein PHV49_03385 [Alistipes sp.]|nr:hypothetical protein [Alistipes sp.]
MKTHYKIVTLYFVACFLFLIGTIGVAKIKYRCNGGPARAEAFLQRLDTAQIRVIRLTEGRYRLGSYATYQTISKDSGRLILCLNLEEASLSGDTLSIPENEYFLIHGGQYLETLLQYGQERPLESTIVYSQDHGGFWIMPD